MENLMTKKYKEILGKKMAYLDEGSGQSIVFLHGNPTSSYLWRNITPHVKDLGRVIVPDLIGMGDSEKLEGIDNPDYAYHGQYKYLSNLLDALDLGNEINLVIHDWGSVLGFDWCFQNQEKTQGIVHMEGIVKPLTWEEWPEGGKKVFQGFRSEAGESMVLDKNIFVERVLPSSIIRELSEEEMNEYRRPFLNSGEDRRPTLSWPRQIPIDGEPQDVTQVVQEYSSWLSQSKTPTLFVNAEPGFFSENQREFCRSLPAQREVTVKGLHFLQEDSP